MGKRTGLLLANIHLGSSVSLWRAIAEKNINCAESALFVFPGGRLDYAESNEHLRNQVFSLANSKNLNSAIVWSSSLTGSLDFKQVGEFVRDLNKNLPIVSLGLSIDGIPSVNFDAYSGIFEEVTHLIRVHKCKKIAFVRGPKNHQSAEKRFLAYKDALEANGLKYDAQLVSSPRSWAYGLDAMEELFEERGLRVGLDFDSIVFASDLMMFWASKYIEKRGFSIGKGLRIAGFNDSDENALMTVAATTVKLPIKALASSAYTLSQEVSSNSSVDIILPTKMIIRDSCGCEDSFGGIKNASNAISSWESLKKWYDSSIDASLSADALFYYLKDVYDDKESILDDNKAKLSAILSSYFENGGKYEIVFECIKWIEHLLSKKRLTSEERDAIYSILAYQHKRSVAYKEFLSKSLLRHVDKFKLELLATSNYPLLIEKMKQYLPEIGISKAFICTYKDDSTTRFEGGFSGNTIFKGGEEFSSQLILSPLYSSELDQGLFVVQPLFYDNFSVGYLILATKCLEGNVLEDIRTSVSTALKGIGLFSIAIEKSKRIEEEEKKSAEFYARLSEGLKGPLNAISSIISSAKIDRNALSAHVAEAAHLVELSLADIGQIQLDLRFVPLKELQLRLLQCGIEIKQDGKLPSVEIDIERICDVFRILSDECSKMGDIPHVNIELEPTSVSFCISGEKNLWNPALAEKNTSMLLAEKIILMHSGVFGFSSKSIKVAIPFPSLDGEPKSSSNLGSVLFIGERKEEIPKSLMQLELIAISQEKLLQDFAIPANISAIAMDISLAVHPSSVLINLLKNHISTKALPFMLFGMESTSISLLAALEGSVPLSQRATIVSFGPFPDTLSKLKEFGTVLELKELSEVDEGCALAIFYDLDIKSLGKMRSSHKFNKTPVLIIKESFSLEDVIPLFEIPNVLVVNPSITESVEFISRLVAIFGGVDLLPPLTSALVKKAIAYINKHARQQISRWQLADAVNISEDYLTRIFRKEIGISPWDYLNRYRIQLASKLLTQTGLSINEIAQDTGFQDQAYFCRVFKKVKGFPPGHIRQRI